MFAGPLLLVGATAVARDVSFFSTFVVVISVCEGGDKGRQGGAGFFRFLSPKMPGISSRGGTRTVLYI